MCGFVSKEQQCLLVGVHTGARGADTCLSGSDQIGPLQCRTCVRQKQLLCVNCSAMVRRSKMARSPKESEGLSKAGSDSFSTSRSGQQDALAPARSGIGHRIMSLVRKTSRPDRLDGEQQLQMPDGVGGGGGEGDPRSSSADSSVGIRRESDTGDSATASNRLGDQIQHADDKQSASHRASEPRRPTVNDFYFGKMLGEGSFSVVYLAREVRTQKEYAKLCRRPHPLVIGLHCTFHDEARLYFVVTYAKNGDLLKHIHKVGNFNAECTRFYSGELMAALRYLHRAGVVHRDIKPENVLMSERMHVLVADFGSAQILPLDTPAENDQPSHEGSVPTTDTDAETSTAAASSPTKKTTSGPEAVGADKVSRFRVRPRPEGPNGGETPQRSSVRRTSFVGTAQYISPEVLVSGPVSPAMDMWALGCVIYQMVSGLPPFRGLAAYHIFQRIINLDYSYPEDFDEDARRVVESLLKIIPKERATIKDLERDSYYAGMDIDKLHLQAPPEIVPFLAGTSEEIDWGKVDAPGLDENQMSRLWGLHLGDGAHETEQKDNPSASSDQPSKPPANVIRPAPKSIMDFTQEEREQRLADQRCRSKWHKFVEGNLILKEGFVDKRKGLFPRRRMLLLTTGPHLYYVDPEKMVLKGQIPWSSTLTPEPKNFKTFFVHTPNRTYNLEDPEGYALRWCKAINEVYEATYGPRPVNHQQHRNPTPNVTGNRGQRSF
ncbi:3-phosphoinositide-dependent protein kinase 1-like isoform X2 [Varroa jacobsoni]|uniref:3-phosphoinositide-dependent protein kinase 1-like isoform X2 n=1 Tax=Varroa jacobsoni TaxID=62625 RepID=UPI000BFA26EC|nr:3-phosphoinositide-dependent protein kinase 1-like isoform X2 [Varroa jacobsoni]